MSNIKQYKQWLFVEVPEGTRWPSLFNDGNGLTYWVNGRVYIDLPVECIGDPFLFLSCSDEFAKKIVRKIKIKGDYYANYELNKLPSMFDTALASLHSLVQSLGMSIENTVIIKMQ